MPDAYEIAVKMLGRRAFSAGELIDRLIKRGIDETEASAAASKLSAEGWIDDAEYAETIAHRLLEDGPADASYVRRRLIERRLDEDLAESVAQRFTASDDPIAEAEAFARTHAAKRGASARRVASALARRGFDEDVVMTVIERLGLE